MPFNSKTFKNQYDKSRIYSACVRHVPVVINNEKNIGQIHNSQTGNETQKKMKLKTPINSVKNQEINYRFTNASKRMPSCGFLVV